MKFFVGLVLVVAAVCSAGVVVSAAVSELEPHNVQQQVAGEAAAADDNLESLRIRKAARSYGGGSASAPAYLPSVPCPKTYLFSCQPQLAPVPCSPSSSGYGGQGAYTEPIAQWAPYPKDN